MNLEKSFIKSVFLVFGIKSLFKLVVVIVDIYDDDLIWELFVYFMDLNNYLILLIEMWGLCKRFEEVGFGV